MSDTVSAEKLVTPDEVRFMKLNRLPTGISPLTVFSNVSSVSRPLLLDRIIREPPEWQLVAQVSSESVPDWFDAQASSI